MTKYDQDELLLRVSEFFKALSDYARMKIVYALLNHFIHTLRLFMHVYTSGSDTFSKTLESLQGILRNL